MVAQRRTRNEVGLENALPEKWWLKGALKRKRGLNNALEKKVGLENALPKGWWCNTDLLMRKQCIMIYMHVYLPEKYRSPFFHGVFLFSKIRVLVVNFDGFFSLVYSSHFLWFWPLGKAWYHHTFFVLHPLSQGLPILPDIFLRKGIMKPALPGVFYCPPVWSCLQVFNSGLGMRLCEGRFDKQLFSCRNFGISKLFQTKKSFWSRFKANSF